MAHAVHGRLVGMIALVTTLAAQANAQSLPSPWSNADIGAPALSGSATETAGTFTVDAGGADIWGTADQFHFVYQQIAGDVQLVVRVQNVTNQHAWSKAGVMIRASLAADAPHGLALVSAAKGVHFQRRTAAGAISASTTGSSTATPPAWVRIVRIGNKVTASWSADGATWKTIGSDTIALGTSAYVGLAVTSHNTAARTTATLSDAAV